MLLNMISDLVLQINRSCVGLLLILVMGWVQIPTATRLFCLLCLVVVLRPQ
jgi:hypothetical protein